MKDLAAQNQDVTNETADEEVPGRREFLKKCGKYAVVAPPARLCCCRAIRMRVL